MKRLAPVFILLAVLASASCKKEKDETREKYLGKEFLDGLLRNEFMYSSDWKPIRKNFYSTSGGVSALAGYYLYNYNVNGQLSEVTIFDENSELSQRYALSYNASSKLTRMDQLNDGGEIAFYHVYDYDQGGRLDKSTLYTAAHKKNVEVLFSYEGSQSTQPIMVRRVSFVNPAPVLHDSTTLVVAKPLPAHWAYFEALPQVALPNGDRTFVDQAYTSQFYYFVDAPPTKTQIDYSGKQYDASGYLTRQVMTRKTQYIGPEQTVSYELTYEYLTR